MKRKSKTCIAAIKTRNGRLLMGADRQVSEDWGFSYKCPYPKIKKFNNGILVGASGDSGLCKLMIDGLYQHDWPGVETDTDTYMYYTFIPAVHKLIKSQPGYTDQHKLLLLAMDESCTMMVGIKGRLYIIDICNPEEEYKESPITRIVLDDLPIPFAIGCGAGPAYEYLSTKKQENRFNTKEDLDKAIRRACEVSPGCGLNDKNEPDIITE